MSADVDVQLDVVDRNNKPPVWDQNVYGPTHIKENVTVGTVVTSVKARFVYHDMTETRHVTCRAVQCYFLCLSFSLSLSLSLFLSNCRSISSSSSHLLCLSLPFLNPITISFCTSSFSSHFYVQSFVYTSVQLLMLPSVILRCIAIILSIFLFVSRSLFLHSIIPPLKPCPVRTVITRKSVHPYFLSSSSSSLSRIDTMTHSALPYPTEAEACMVG